MLGGIGAQELLLIILAALLLFGAKRIPEIARGMGKGITEFKRAIRDAQNEIEDAGKSEKPKIDKKEETDGPTQG
ncbi:MAG: twin-arginine translocase TatA/TatE family subunit [candidate division Zixibacteria bacterium]|nr:twin-arginine translocase TatA/TatE family subunit [candidate division Zixibacteria bacterium]